jgi:hypothetical protein
MEPGFDNGCSGEARIIPNVWDNQWFAGLSDLPGKTFPRSQAVNLFDKFSRQPTIRNYLQQARAFI